MLAIKLVILVITVCRAEQRQVLLADNHGSGTLYKRCNGVLLDKLPRVLEGFIIVSETGNLHAMHAVGFLNVDVETTYRIAHKIVTGHLKQQFVLVY